MRTTINIDDDVLQAARELAAIQNKTVGEIISTLVRHALTPAEAGASSRNGIPLLPARAGSPRVTSELVRELLEENA
jgi:Arc/MetJ family transcription regulator